MTDFAIALGCLAFLIVAVLAARQHRRERVQRAARQREYDARIRARLREL